MAVNAGPLTTIWTPPPSCTDVITSAVNLSPSFADGYSLFVAHWGEYVPASTACYPASTTSFDFADNNYYYSPGICPRGYTTACPYTDSIVGSETTASLCCPSGFACLTGWPHVCYSSAAAVLTNVFTITDIDETLPASAQLATVTPAPGDTVWGDGVPVMWQSTDTEILLLLGLLTSTTAPPTTTSASLTTTSTTSTPSSTSTGTSTTTTSSARQTSSTSSSSATSSSTITTTSSSSASGAQWQGSGFVLTGTCSTAEWTLLDLSTAYLWAPVIGCVQDKPGCCPFSVAAATTTSKPSNPFPTASGAASNNVLDQCPDDYSTISNTGCCPIGLTPYPTPLGGVTACASQLSITPSPPTIPSSESPGANTPLAISTATGIVFAAQYTVQPPATGLTTAQKAGIGVGSAVGSLAVLAGLAACVLRRPWRRPRQKRMRDGVWEGDGFGHGAADGRRMSELPGEGRKHRRSELSGARGQVAQTVWRPLPAVGGYHDGYQGGGGGQTYQNSGQVMRPHSAGTGFHGPGLPIGGVHTGVGRSYQDQPGYGYEGGGYSYARSELAG